MNLVAETSRVLGRVIDNQRGTLSYNGSSNIRSAVYSIVELVTEDLFQKAVLKEKLDPLNI